MRVSIDMLCILKYQHFHALHHFFKRKCTCTSRVFHGNVRVAAWPVDLIVPPCGHVRAIMRAMWGMWTRPGPGARGAWTPHHTSPVNLWGFEQFWTVLKRYELFWTVLNCSESFWTVLKFWTVRFNFSNSKKSPTTHSKLIKIIVTHVISILPKNMRDKDKFVYLRHLRKSVEKKKTCKKTPFDHK